MRFSLSWLYDTSVQPAMYNAWISIFAMRLLYAWDSSACWKKEENSSIQPPSGLNPWGQPSSTRACTLYPRLPMRRTCHSNC